MGKITVLDQQTANSIAAGEVIDRPFSVVKELVENALDAGASQIYTDILQGGISMIQVRDNGIGMDQADLELAATRHATSKLQLISDLDHIQSMGFRGEALASVAAVAELSIESRQPGTETGYRIVLRAGERIQSGTCGCAEGTTVTVRDLFFNTPARFKFLRKDSVEAGAIAEMIGRLAMTRPDVAFRLTRDQKEILFTPGNNDLTSVIYAVWGAETANALVPVEQQSDGVKVTGLLALPAVSRNNRSRQVLMVNRRLITSRALSAAIDEAAKTWFMKGRFPVCVLNLSLATNLVDINVHPQKTEVRFWDERVVFRAVYHAVRQALLDHGTMAEPDLLPPQATAESGPQQTAPCAEQLEMAVVREQTVWPTPENTPRHTAPPASSMQQAVDRTHGGQQPAKPAAGTEQAPAAAMTRQQPPDVRPPAVQTADPAARTVNALQGARVVGVLFGTYLVVEAADQFMLIDQHAAHERILYEKLLANRQASIQQRPPQRPLLEAATVEVTELERAGLLQHQEQIEALGFSFDDFGERTVLLRSVPDSGKLDFDPLKAFQIIVDAVQDDTLDLQSQATELYHQIACKAAVKAHDRLDPAESARLLLDLQALDNPYHCPHGRPVLIRITRQDLEKRFKRIV